ncbi:MAG: hypothetical protein A2341_09480 [Deltaproteobacteria bacterium RIFOXYB12_FULL_58_9]|nr:MAG: hypothetical protein A2341_09480 [Deltaproteobacteria bacterium RIFOXYB12_FULL_58_9]
MMPKIILLILSLALPVNAWAAEDEAVQEEDLGGRAGAGSERKTLAERIPAVTGRVFAKSGRLELSPGFGLSLNDPFYDHIVASGAVAYHVTEWLWIGGSADFYISPSSTIAVANRDPEQFDYNRPVYTARLEVGWSPIYGKLSLLAEQVFHFDTYVSAGVGVVGPSETDATLAGTFAIGEHFFINEWMAFKLELRDQIFGLARAPAKNKDKELQNFLSATLGVCFYLPPTFEVEAAGANP